MVRDTCLITDQIGTTLKAPIHVTRQPSRQLPARMDDRQNLGQKVDSLTPTASPDIGHTSWSGASRTRNIPMCVCVQNILNYLFLPRGLETPGFP
jgi:hypothetical protein